MSSLPQSEVTFVSSAYGGRILIHNSYAYVLDKSKPPTEYWKCREYRKDCFGAPCRGRLTLTDGQTPVPTAHSHPSSASSVEALKTKLAIKKRAAQSMDLPRQVIQNVTFNLPISTCVELPNNVAIARMIERERKKDAIPCAKPNKLCDIDTSYMEKSARDEKFLLHDSGPVDPQRLIVWATTANLVCLCPHHNRTSCAGRRNV